MQGSDRTLQSVMVGLAVPIGALLVSSMIFGVFIALTGRDPVAVFHTIYRGGFGTWFSWQNALQRAAPLMLTALCTALPARLGLIVIGGEGALVVGGIAAATLGLLLGGVPPLLASTVLLLAAFCAGGVWIAVVGWLRYARGINETIASLLMNYLAIAVLNHLVTGPLRDPASLNKPSTRPLADTIMLGQLPGLNVHWGLAFGMLLCLLYFLIYRYTTVGFAARVVGGNLRAARLVGIAVGPLTLATAFMAGASAGLAGGLEVLAVHGRANDSLVTGYGYAGILVAFLARQSPLAVIPVAILLGGINASGGLLQRAHGLPDATVLVLQGILFLVLLLSETVRDRLLQHRWRGVSA